MLKILFSVKLKVKVWSFCTVLGFDISRWQLESNYFENLYIGTSLIIGLILTETIKSDMFAQFQIHKSTFGLNAPLSLRIDILDLISRIFYLFNTMHKLFYCLLGWVGGGPAPQKGMIHAVRRRGGQSGLGVYRIGLSDWGGGILQLGVWYNTNTPWCWVICLEGFKLLV